MTSQHVQRYRNWKTSLLAIRQVPMSGPVFWSRRPRIPDHLRLCTLDCPDGQDLLGNVLGLIGLPGFVAPQRAPTYHTHLVPKAMSG